jgi:mutator protein MutT
MAGLWEFPGGKCEPGESVSETTARECLEEVGVEVSVGELVHQVTHLYPHGLVELHYFRCRIRGTKTEPDTDSGFRWVASGDLTRYRFPEANDAVIEVLTLEGVEARGLPRDES